jgi:hypothetical protein
MMETCLLGPSSLQKQVGKEASGSQAGFELASRSPSGNERVCFAYHSDQGATALLRSYGQRR